jgi:hypothetical protein
MEPEQAAEMTDHEWADPDERTTVLQGEGTAVPLYRARRIRTAGAGKNRPSGHDTASCSLAC